MFYDSIHNKDYIYDCPYLRKYELSFYKSRVLYFLFILMYYCISWVTKFLAILHFKRNIFKIYSFSLSIINNRYKSKKEIHFERIDQNINSNILLRSRYDMTKQILANRINNCLQTLLSGRGLSIVDHSDHYLRITMSIDTYLRFIQIRLATTM